MRAGGGVSSLGLRVKAIGPESGHYSAGILQGSGTIHTSLVEDDETLCLETSPMQAKWQKEQESEARKPNWIRILARPLCFSGSLSPLSLGFHLPVSVASIQKDKASPFPIINYDVNNRSFKRFKTK